MTKAEEMTYIAKEKDRFPLINWTLKNPGVIERSFDASYREEDKEALAELLVILGKE